jgi:hypothetical protein
MATIRSNIAVANLKNHADDINFRTPYFQEVPVAPKSFF